MAPNSATYLVAARAFAELVRAIPESAWNEPGLGDWDVRALVGHASRSLITVSTYLRQPAEHEDVASAAEYYLRVRDIATDAGSEAIVERGRQAGRDLGADPAGTVDAWIDRVVAELAEVEDPLIQVIGGLGIRLSSYLPTRVLELAVHGLDIARATGRRFDVPANVLDEAAALAVRVGVALGTGEDILLALTGRIGLPAGFSVV